jgi:hypothetical protein
MAGRAVLAQMLVVASVSFQGICGRPNKAMHAEPAEVGILGSRIIFSTATLVGQRRAAS